VVLTDQILEWVLRTEGAATDPHGLVRHSPSEEKAYLLDSLFEEAIHSSLIEGAVTTRVAAKTMLRRRRAPRNDGERMVLNNFRTIEMLADLADEPLSPGLILDIHRSMTEGTLEDARDEGRIQVPSEERVVVSDITGEVVHAPPPADQLPERLEQLCNFANATEPFLPPLVRASLIHFQLAYDHPFVDGTGRTARALFYWLLIRARHRLVRYLSISRIIHGSKRRYERAYVHVEQTCDTTYFLHYHVDVYRKAIDALGTWLERRREQARVTREALADWAGLNHRQKLVVKQSLDDPTTAWHAASHATTQGVTHQTALTDLKGLVVAGLLVQQRDGRGYVFLPVPDLARRVADGPDADPRQAPLFE